MASATSNGKNSNGPLQETLTGLIQSQAVLTQTQAILNQTLAALNQTQAAYQVRHAEIEARIAEMDRINSERFARIEALLLEHNRILQALPDVMREKIGFKGS